MMLERGRRLDTRTQTLPLVREPAPHIRSDDTGASGNAGARLRDAAGLRGCASMISDTVVTRLLEAGAPDIC